jgi:alanine racemase
VDITGLKPALSWYSWVAFVKTLEPGREIGYGGAFTTTKPTRVATIPVGYADGYRRSLSNKFYVLIRGKKAPILGRVCMDQMMVDVTDIPDVEVGDKVTLLGDTITAEAMGEAADSFNYETVCAISKRVSRYYER